MTPIHISFTLDITFLYYLLVTALFALWFFLPVLVSLPEKLKLKEPKVSMARVVLGIVAAFPWVLTATILSFIGIGLNKLAGWIFTLVIKMKAKIW